MISPNFQSYDVSKFEDFEDDIAIFFSDLLYDRKFSVVSY